MSQYPQQYYPEQGDYAPAQYYYYTPTRYQVMGVMDALIGVMVLVAVGAWALSLIKKAVRGEEVEFPL